jgi:hypothetical protein
MMLLRVVTASPRLPAASSFLSPFLINNFQSFRHSCVPMHDVFIDLKQTKSNDEAN